MARSPLPRDELSRIVADQMPGYTLAEPADEALDAAGPAAAPDAVSPDLATLRRKYLADAAPEAEVATAADFAPDRAARTAPPETGADADADDLGMAVVKPTPTVARDARDAGAKPKSVIVSTSTGRIVGAQG